MWIMLRKVCQVYLPTVAFSRTTCSSSSSFSSSASRLLKRNARKRTNGDKHTCRWTFKREKLSKKIRELRAKLESLRNNVVNQFQAVDSLESRAKAYGVFTLGLEYKLNEPSIPTHPFLRKVQHLCKAIGIKYAIHKCKNNTAIIRAIPIMKVMRKKYDPYRHLIYSRKSYAAPTLFILRQRETFHASLSKLLQLARDSHVLILSVMKCINYV